MPQYSAREQRNIDTVNNLFEADTSFDRLAVFDPCAVLFNWLPHIGDPPGQTEHRGIEAIAKLMAGSADAGNLDRGVDAYDLATTEFRDVLVLADGDYVVRQHTQHSRTLAGRDYCNVYCFVMRFNVAGRIVYVTEHWNTWYAHKILLENWRPGPARPLG